MQNKENSIALVTDSSCDLPKDLMDKLSIHFLPLKIIYKDKIYNDRIDIKPQEVYDKIKEEIPTTSMPTPSEIKNKFLELKEKGFTKIIVITISSGLSGTYNTIKMLANQINGVSIEVFDSKALSMGMGRVVLYANQLIKQGLDFNEIISKIKIKIDEIKLFFVVKTLEYLIKGGRIGRVKGTIGELLNIKPIISINQEGKYYTYDKARSRKKSIDRLYQIIKEKIKEGLYQVDVMHADACTEATNLLNRFKKIKNVKETSLGEISPAMVVHAGPGLIGVCINRLE